MNEFSFIRCNDEKSFSAMHEIREKVLFTSGKYDRHHPDDNNPNHHCFIFMLMNIPVATVRLDFIDSDEVAVRLVAVLPEYQGQKIGSRMLSAVEDFAKQKGITRIVTNAAVDAKAFYEAIGFISENWVDTGEGISRPTIPMVKRLNYSPTLIKATMNDYPVIQNLACFYVYELSRYCGFISDEWSCPSDGMYRDVDLKKYFQDSARESYLIKIGNELAGFALLHNIKSSVESYWVMAEFFILAKFQGHSIGRQIAEQLWKLHPGKWQVPIIPENKKALVFWRKAISSFTDGHYKEEIKIVDYDKHQPKRYILSFDTNDVAEASVIEIEEIDHDQAEELCRKITKGLPEYFGISSANEQYFEGVRSCKNFAAKIKGHYVGLLSLNFPYGNNSNIYWMAVMKGYQARGIGSKLIEEACRVASKLNASTMTVETLSPEHADDNYLKTWKFYQSAGFKPLINLRPEGYQWNMVYMVKNLKS
jgi:predicted acetyltransferase/GNAT superfamily N-acetyltransferase